MEGGEGEAEQGQEQGEEDPRGDEQDHDGEGGVPEGQRGAALGEVLVVDVQVDALGQVAPAVTHRLSVPGLDALPQGVVDPGGGGGGGGEEERRRRRGGGGGGGGGEEEENYSTNPDQVKGISLSLSLSLSLSHFLPMRLVLPSVSI